MADLWRGSFEEDFARFCESRENECVSDRDFGQQVCRLPLFSTKLALATRIAARRNADADEAGQRAIFSIRKYFEKTRGRDFAGTTADELAGWFYCLARQHVRWALANIRREDRRRQHHEQAAGKALVLPEDAAARAAKRAALVDAVAKLPDELRRIVAAILLGDDMTTIVEQLAISRRTFYRLRKRALDLLREWLNEDDLDDDGSSSMLV